LRIFPNGWQVLPFDEAIEDVTGGSAKVQTRDYLPEGRLRVIDQGQSDVAGYVDDVNLACKAPLPCILFGDHTRIFKFAKAPFALGADGVKVLVPRKGLDARFAFYYLRTVRLPDDLGYSRHFKYLRETVVPVPSLETQRRIADILDKADAICRKRKDAIALTDELLRSAFLEMLGDPVTNPKGWKTVPLEHLVDNDRGISYGVVQRGPEVDDGVPVVRISNFGENRFDGTSVVRTSSDISNAYRRTLLRGGELVVSIRGTVGRVAVVPPTARGWNVSREVAVVPLLENVSRSLVHRALLSDGVQRFILGNVKGVAQSGINLADLRQAPIPVPSSVEIERFERFVATVDAGEKKLTSAMKESEVLFESLIHRAFSGGLAANAREIQEGVA
jgi:type I restriction enzyme S subunit